VVALLITCHFTLYIIFVHLVQVLPIKRKNHFWTDLSVARKIYQKKAFFAADVGDDNDSDDIEDVENDAALVGESSTRCNCTRTAIVSVVDNETMATTSEAALDPQQQQKQKQTRHLQNGVEEGNWQDIESR